mmetsp:Transcript_25371/g.24723  ORF Transcript_25371/g.24723 Transcript_25371/m.24723 type:complete len:124 (-) Transcript_25371:691-1062(-)
MENATLLKQVEDERKGVAKQNRNKTLKELMMDYNESAGRVDARFLDYESTSTKFPSYGGKLGDHANTFNPISKSVQVSPMANSQHRSFNKMNPFNEVKNREPSGKMNGNYSQQFQFQANNEDK